ncbi:UNVERIFIED_CONTAM: hypothetical protein FKN15_014467 [Acipenser sinensis]
MQPPRATASEDNAALGSLQASPQAPGQTTGVAGARICCCVCFSSPAFEAKKKKTEEARDFLDGPDSAVSRCCSVPLCFGAQAHSIQAFGAPNCAPLVLWHSGSQRLSAHGALGALTPLVPQCSKVKRPWCLTPSGPQSFQSTQCPQCGASRSDTLGASIPSGPQSLGARSALGASASLVPRCPRVKRPQCSSPLGAPSPSGPRSLGAHSALGASVPRYLDAPLFFVILGDSEPRCT